MEFKEGDFLNAMKWAPIKGSRKDFEKNLHSVLGQCRIEQYHLFHWPEEVNPAILSGLDETQCLVVNYVASKTHYEGDRKIKYASVVGEMASAYLAFHLWDKDPQIIRDLARDYLSKAEDRVRQAHERSPQMEDIVFHREMESNYTRNELREQLIADLTEEVRRAEETLQKPHLYCARLFNADQIAWKLSIGDDSRLGYISTCKKKVFRIPWRYIITRE